MTRSLVRQATLLAVALALPVVATAQASARTGTTPVPKDARTTSVAIPAREPSLALTLLPTTVTSAVIVTGATNEPTVVTIPVPDGLPARARINYTVTPHVDGAVLGRLTGAIPPGTPGQSRHILFAIRTPRQLAAGEVRLATARFATAVEAVEVPIVARIGTARDIRIAPASTLGAARAGEPFAIGYRVSNLGNAPDSVSVQAILPPGWRVLDPAALLTFAVPMRATIDRQLRVLPPANAQGIVPVRLVVMAGGAPVAEAQLDIQIVGGHVAIGPAGPVLTLGAAAAQGPWGELAHVQTMQLEGQVSDGTMIWARASTAPWRQGAASYALSRANVLSSPPALQLSSQDWRLGLGVLGTTLSDLTGVNLVGEGATFAITQPGWKATVLAANPDLGFTDAEGSLLGGRIEATPGRLTLSTTVTSLRETRTQDRQLDAVAIGTGWNGILGGQWAGEVARRRYAGLEASGWSSSYSRRTTDDNIELRYVNAPGGTSAFARATSELAASGSRRVGDRLTLMGTYWRSEDGGSESLSGLDMRGWTAGANMQVGEGVTAAVVARQSEFAAATTIGDFGSGERGLEASLDGRGGTLQGRLSASATMLRRITSAADEPGTRFTQEAPRYGVRGTLGVTGARGAVMVNGQYDRSGAGIGFAPVQWSYGVEVARAMVPGLGDHVRLHGAAERLGGFSSGMQQTTLRAGVELDLPLDATISMSAERNPYILSGDGEGSWMYVVGVTRAVRLPRIRNGGTRGEVYRDLNGNGAKDAGEPGFAGVVLRRGSEVGMTDYRGAFSLGGDEREPFEVDVRSLPIGFLTASTSFAPGTKRIGVLPVSPVVVELSLDAADTSRVTVADLADVAVVATDSTGREWMSRRESRTRVVFDALPPGRYALSIDASAVREPLRPVADIPAVHVTTGRFNPPVRVVLRARSLRFSTPNPPGTPGRR